MRVQYVFEEREVEKAKSELKRLRWVTLASRDAGDMEASREFYFKAKGFEDALTVLGILKKKDDNKP